MPRRICSILSSLLAACVCGIALGAEPVEPTWPWFNGPDRNNISTETALLKSWPDGGPTLLWKYGNCGQGHSMVSVANNTIFTAGDFDDDEMVFALDLNGNVKWKSPNGAAWHGAYPGSRTTPTFDAGVVYHLNPHGRLAAFAADSGKELWKLDLVSQFGARPIRWALAENLLVDGDRLFCTPGGKNGLLVALDKRTGKTLWANTELDETAAYCSPNLVTWKGTRQLITMTQKSVISLDPVTGKLLWSHPHITPNDQNIIMPLFHDGYVLVSSGHKGGTAVFKINDDSRGVSDVWAAPLLDNCHGGIILAGGSIYGSACRSGGKTFFCADFLSGKVSQSDATLGKVSLTCADGMLYGLTHRGKMLLMGIKPGSFNVISRFALPREDTEDYLTHPVVCGGRLYIRHSSSLYVYDIKN